MNMEIDTDLALKRRTQVLAGRSQRHRLFLLVLCLAIEKSGELRSLCIRETDTSTTEYRIRWSRLKYARLLPEGLQTVSISQDSSPISHGNRRLDQYNSSRPLGIDIAVPRVTWSAN